MFYIRGKKVIVFILVKDRSQVKFIFNFEIPKIVQKAEKRGGKIVSENEPKVKIDSIQCKWSGIL